MLSVSAEQCGREVVSPVSNCPLIAQELTADEVNILGTTSDRCWEVCAWLTRQRIYDNALNASCQERTRMLNCKRDLTDITKKMCLSETTISLLQMSKIPAAPCAPLKRWHFTIISCVIKWWQPTCSGRTQKAGLRLHTTSRGVALQ